MGSRRVRLAHATAVVALLWAATAGHAFAQASGSIRGRVVEAATGRPLASAQVFLPGTSRGGLTNAAGDFLLLNVPAGTHTLSVQLIGFAPTERQVTVVAGEVARVTFELSVSAIAMEEIVVTGTAGATTKRTLGNAITKLDAATVTQQTAITNLTELLQAKTPGLQVLPNAGTVGTASHFQIRGAGSLTNTNPVVYIDGIRYNNEELGTFTPSGAGTTSYSGQVTSALDLINPNDIESIEVIKGPAAATLYGAEAANGVIQIITKKGRFGEQAVRWDVRSEYGQNEWALNIPANYTTCTAERIAEVDAAGNPVWPGCQGQAPATVLKQSPLEEDPAALRAGEVKRLSVSARGGAERYSYYFAADMNQENGVFYNNYNDRNSVRANFTVRPSDWIDLLVTTAYARGNIRLPVGDEAAQAMLLSAFRGRPGRVTAVPENMGWGTTRAEQANSYDNTTRSDRLTLGTTANISPVRWFRNRITLGLDYTASLAQILSPPGSTDASYAGVPTGLVAQRVPRNYVYTFDYAGNIDRALPSAFSSTTSFGMQAIWRKYERVDATGTGLGAPDVTLISAATTTIGSNSFSENKSLGLFAQEQIGWHNRLFVTGALRADDNSSFGEAFDWLVYPKLSVSYVMSEEPALGGLFDMARVNTFKFRMAWGQAGQAPAPFSATQTYTVDKGVRPDGTVVPALRARSYGNPELSAERGAELEVGFDAGLFDDRVGIDFTYYNKKMRDVIIALSAPGSSGFAGTFYGSTGSILKNLGETANSGIELAISAMPVRTPKLAWDTRINVMTNKNELVDFGDGRPEMIVSGQSYGSVQRHRPGYPLGGYWFYLPVRNPDGTPKTTMVGTVAVPVVTDSLQYIGPAVPTREISFANTVTLVRDFRLFVLFDHKGGHYLFNYKEYNRCAIQRNCERLNEPSMLQSADTVIWRSTTSRTETGNVNRGAPFGFWIEPASFIKLRDVSLTYTLPSAVVQAFRASAASLTLAAHNLAQWTDYSGIDPEVSGYGNRAFGRADVYPVPMLRRVSMSMNLSF